MYHFWTQNTFTVSCPIAQGGWGGGEVLGLGFAGYVLLASQYPYPIKNYSMANYRSHLIHY